MSLGNKEKWKLSITMCVKVICNGQGKNTNWVGLKSRCERKIIMLTSILNNFNLLSNIMVIINLWNTMIFSFTNNTSRGANEYYSLNSILTYNSHTLHIESLSLIPTSQHFHLPWSRAGKQLISTAWPQNQYQREAEMLSNRNSVLDGCYNMK